MEKGYVVSLYRSSCQTSDKQRFLDNLEKFIFDVFSVHPHFNAKYLKTGPTAKGAHLDSLLTVFAKKQ